MQARQRVQLTGTNRSFGLIALIFNAHRMTCDIRRKTDIGCRRMHETTSLSEHGDGRADSHPCPLSSDLRHPSFAGLVVFAGSLNPIPSRTRPLNFPAPMVLSLKTWKSRSLPGLPRTETSSPRHAKAAAAIPAAAFCCSQRPSGGCRPSECSVGAGAAADRPCASDVRGNSGPLAARSAAQRCSSSGRSASCW